MRHALMASTAGALLLAGCGSEPAEQKTADSLTGAQKVEAIASTLQACSYDGRPVEAAPAALAGPAPNECAVAVNRIMGYTGLPANFVVVSGPVPNAAAVILLDDKRVPRRVIAFNPEFMAAAHKLSGGSPWGPISVMAHEIAHHLSGHTIVPGGSRPEIELEADKFSGFVLNKMGAPLAAASQMIMAVGTDHGSPTHPGKAQRADAIRQGWTQSCIQSGGTGCDAGTATPPPATPPAGPPIMVAAQPLPAPGSIPFKYGRFIVDETGKLDPAITRDMDQKLYTLAKDAGAEFTILVVNDLKGMSADDYAWAMMRQLRVGKLDVGNGAVVVVAPRQRQAAVAFGPGFAKEAEFSDPKKALLSWIDNGWGYCDDADGCKTWTDALFGNFRLTLSNAARAKWTVQNQPLGRMIGYYEQVAADRARTKRPFDAASDTAIGNLIRVSGKVTSLNPPTGFGQANERLLGGQLGYRAVSMTTDDGYPVILYVTPRLAGLMPSGQIRADTRYTMVGRIQRTGDKDKQASAMWLFSYDQL